MSAAAYDAAHQAAIDARSGSRHERGRLRRRPPGRDRRTVRLDMSAAAYDAAHQAAIDARSGCDMSTAAYDAAHQAAIDARSGTPH